MHNQTPDLVVAASCDESMHTNLISSASGPIRPNTDHPVAGLIHINRAHISDGIVANSQTIRLN
ncbi:hypothetical protein DSO57_1034670 [Entomophthora muscae]|uniref:Uncharacterized protein n=1 Tax=Entomophthora muscae TaxID=34485 RepID=A0ACC2U9Q1_9FUNG|nr:hypothetical protein DSO57_1034670 [Entomophthora muscae]